MRILGLDNSTRSTGYCIIDIDKTKKDNAQYKLIDYGLIKRDKKDLQEMLFYFESKINEIIDTFKPEAIACEDMFIGNNRQTGRALSLIHGIMLLCSFKKQVPVTYYAVMTLKSKILDGIKIKKEDGTRKSGKEMKQEVQNKVIEILGKENFTKEYNDDVTDSMSAAIVFNMLDGKEVEKKKKTKKKADK